jgi:hypothetical protein
MTIVNRRTFTAARGKNQEAIDLLREGAKDSGTRYRILSSSYGRFDEIALEVEFETMAQMEQFWAEFDAAPGSMDLLARWNDLTEPGGLNEVWVLEAQG